MSKSIIIIRSLSDLFDVQPDFEVRLLQEIIPQKRSDRDAIAQDWKNIGKDIYKAMELIHD